MGTEIWRYDVLIVLGHMLTIDQKYHIANYPQVAFNAYKANCYKAARQWAVLFQMLKFHSIVRHSSH